MSTPTLVTLRPGRWTPVPGTRCEVRWDGEREITVHRQDDAWDLSAIPSPPGYLLARVHGPGRPPSPPWPIEAAPLRTLPLWPGGHIPGAL
jgi:hypothetical protein